MSDWTPPNCEHPPPKAGEPPLHAAARRGDHDAIRALVVGGAGVDDVFDIALNPSEHTQPATALMVAAGSGDGASVETVRLLIELGADPARIVGHSSAATFASTGLGWNYRPGGDVVRLRFLLEAGSPLPSNPANANRMLCDVVESGDAERLGVLLERGLAADGYWDAASECLPMVTHELEPDKLAWMPEDVRESFTESMAAMEREMHEQMVSAPSCFEIPLFCAAQSGNVACLQLLLDAGADPAKRDNFRRTAMYHATSVEVVRALQDAGVPIEDDDRFGWSPLVNAIQDGKLAAISALIECGADVTATHDHGSTTIMSAFYSEHCLEVIQLLVDAGADAHAVTDFGDNAFHAAIDCVNESTDDAGVRRTFSALNEMGIPIEHRNNAGQTPLAVAIEQGTGFEVRVLCELGADPNADCPMRDCGETSCERVESPLLVAAASVGVDSDEKVAALLGAGADPLAHDADGFSALSHVVAALCEDADDAEGAFQAFFDSLSTLRFSGPALPPTRAQFMAEAMPILQAHVESFAAGIPIAESCEFLESWRRERIRCIALLAAAQGWARHQIAG